MVDVSTFDFIHQYRELLRYHKLFDESFAIVAKRTGLKLGLVKLYKNTEKKIMPNSLVIFQLSHRFNISPAFFFEKCSVVEFLKNDNRRGHPYEKLILNLKTLPESQQIGLAQMIYVLSTSFMDMVTKKTYIEGTKEENIVKTERELLNNAKLLLGITDETERIRLGPSSK